MAFAEYPLAQPHTDAQRLPLLVRLHDWVVTVDHKRLGIMYICTGLLFFAVGGLEASIMRWQLAFPNHDVVAPEVFNRLFTMHGTTMVFLFRHADHPGHGQLPDAPDDRGARSGVPTPECFWVLAVAVRRLAPVL